MLPRVTHEGRTFDRFPSKDPRRGNHMAVEVLEPVQVQPKSWASRLTTDQGREGACVGHGQTTDAVASPMPATKATTAQANEFAFDMYHRAQQLDPWAGEDYEGTSVDAGFKAIRELGWIDAWKWLENATQVRDAVIQNGPVVLGINWYYDMYETRPSGLVTVGGQKVGGHCITIIGYHPSMRIRGEDWNERFEVFKWKNSWGTDYGVNGIGYIKKVDLDELLIDGGEAAMAVGRHKVKMVDYLAEHQAA